jgi:hypothetical protein
MMVNPNSAVSSYITNNMPKGSTLSRYMMIDAIEGMDRIQDFEREIGVLKQTRVAQQPLKLQTYQGL